MDDTKRLELIEALYDCTVKCNYCADRCLDSGVNEAMVDCIRTARACAEICSTTANMLAMKYKDIGDLLKYCHRLCRSCETECSKHDYQHCNECEKACNTCAKLCKDMLVKYETSNIKQNENYF